MGDLSDDLARRVEAAARAGGVVADLDQAEMAAQALLAFELAGRFVGHSEEFELFAAERDYELTTGWSTCRTAWPEQGWSTRQSGRPTLWRP